MTPPPAGDPERSTQRRRAGAPTTPREETMEVTPNRPALGLATASSLLAVVSVALVAPWWTTTAVAANTAAWTFLLAHTYQQLRYAASWLDNRPAGTWIEYEQRPIRPASIAGDVHAETPR